MKIGVNGLFCKRIDMQDQYDDIIREQLEEGVVEKAPAKVTSKEFYMPTER